MIGSSTMRILAEILPSGQITTLVALKQDTVRKWPVTQESPFVSKQCIVPLKQDTEQ
jgi:hypothetical protein